MLQGAFSLLADHWLWFALPYLASCTYVLALCRAAKRGDAGWEHAARELRASERARRALEERDAGVATRGAGQIRIVRPPALPQPRGLDLGEGVAELAHRFLRDCAQSEARESLILCAKMGGHQVPVAGRNPHGLLPIALAHTIAEVEGNRLKLFMIVE
jgi:hypothetical protein